MHHFIVIIIDGSQQNKCMKKLLPIPLISSPLDYKEKENNEKYGDQRSRLSYVYIMERNMLKINEGRVYLALDSKDIHSDKITKFLGIEPASITLNGPIFHNKLNPKKDMIMNAIKKFSASPRLEVVLWFSKNEKHSTPTIGFEIETIKFLGDIGAFIDIDTYQH